MRPCPLVLGIELAGVALRALAFRQRNVHRASATRAKTTTPPTTPPAIAPLFTDEPPTTDVGDVTDELFAEELVEDVLWDGDGVEDGGMEDRDEAARHDTSVPLTAKVLEDMTPAGV